MESRRITTSLPCSTSLLALSRTISATWTCRVACSSKVEEMTSALTVRSMSVTSSGRSSMRRTMRYHLGVVRRDRVRDLLEEDGLSGLGRRHDEGALPLTDGAEEVNDARRGLLAVVRLEVEPSRSG